ncbi:MAG: ATP-dependent Clp protease proteolytic subunit [Lachnospiraceae bacterium]|nr:ATP-dependent Clp protease proteolytic subunit [Lachnospiraceae bacterium]
MGKGSNNEELKNRLDSEQLKGELIKDYGQITLSGNRFHQRIHLLNIIGEIEGHENLGNNSKTSKYEHILPQLAAVEDSDDIDGVLVLLNTVGGDVEAGLAIAEMISSLSKPKVCLVLGGGHSIGVPLAVSGDVTYIVPSATMVIHPIRISGTVLGVRQNFEYIERMQERIIDFTVNHSMVKDDELRRIMFNTTELTKDVGSMLVGRQAVEKGIIDRVGGINSALNCLYDLINSGKNSKITEYGFLDD